MTIRLGIIGVGGFAARHHAVVSELEGRGECRLAATCDPSADALDAAGRAWGFAERGVRVYPEYVEMLDACRGGIDLVVIPTPIPLHGEMHRACVERGMAVYLEKPPTLDPDELEEMIRNDANARKRTAVGFHLVSDPVRRDLRSRICAREFGEVRRVVYYGLWPRPVSYFRRAGWAGKVRVNGRLTLDSCFGNAMAHYVHNAFLWSARESVEVPAQPVRARAELYRGHEIEGADTFFVSAETDGGVELRIAMTHACSGDMRHEERIECERATVRFRAGRDYEITWGDGRVEAGPAEGKSDFLRLCHLACYEHLQGKRERPMVTLEDCRPFVQLNAMCYLSAGRIVPLPEEECSSVWADGPSGRQCFVSVGKLDGLIMGFAETGEFPSEADVSWAQPSEREVTPGDLPEIRVFAL